MKLNDIEKEIQLKKNELAELNRKREEIIEAQRLTDNELKKYSGKVMRYHNQKSSGDEYIYIFIGTIHIYDRRLSFNDSYYIISPDNGEFSAGYKYSFGKIGWSMSILEFGKFKEVIPDDVISHISEFINHMKQCWPCNNNLINDYTWHNISELPSVNCEMLIMKDNGYSLKGWYDSDTKEFEYVSCDEEENKMNLDESTEFTMWMQIPDSIYLRFKREQ